MGQNVVKITQNTLFLSKNTAPAQKIGTFRGGLRDFGSEITKNTRIPPSPPPELELLMENFAGDWCVETNRCVPCGYRLVENLVVVKHWQKVPLQSNHILLFAVCNPGSSYNNVTGRCEACAVDTFSDQISNDACTPCPNKTSTAGQTGSTECRKSSTSTIL